jgi:hypothetical protein
MSEFNRSTAATEVKAMTTIIADQMYGCTRKQAQECMKEKQYDLISAQAEMILDVIAKELMKA